MNAKTATNRTVAVIGVAIVAIFFVTLAVAIFSADFSGDDTAAGDTTTTAPAPGSVDLTTATTMPLDQLVDIAIADIDMGELCSSYHEAVAAAGPEAAYNVALGSFVNGGGDSTRQFGYEPSAVLDEVLGRCQ